MSWHVTWSCDVTVVDLRYPTSHPANQFLPCPYVGVPWSLSQVANMILSGLWRHIMICSVYKKKITSLDWLKRTSTENHGFSHFIWAFPVYVPLNQSSDYSNLVQGHYLWTNWLTRPSRPMSRHGLIYGAAVMMFTAVMMWVFQFYCIRVF